MGSDLEQVELEGAGAGSSQASVLEYESAEFDEKGLGEGRELGGASLISLSGTRVTLQTRALDTCGNAGFSTATVGKVEVVVQR